MRNSESPSREVAPQKLILRSIATGDLDDVASVHWAAFPESAITMLGLEAARRYYEWLLVGPHDADQSGVFVDGTCAGFCFAGIFRGATSGFLRRNLAFLAWDLITHPWLMRNELFRSRLRFGGRVMRKHGRSAPAAPRLDEPRPRSFGVLAVAVEPRWQHFGIGRILMGHAEAAACIRGFKEMHLTVHPENHQAVSFYEGLGWQKHAPGGTWLGDMRKHCSLRGMNKDGKLTIRNIDHARA